MSIADCRNWKKPESYPRAHSGHRGCSSTQPLDPHSSHELVHAVWVLVVWSLCKVCKEIIFKNTFLVTCMKSNKLRLFTTSWSSWSPPSLKCSSNLQPFVFQRPQSSLLSSHFLAEPFLAGNLIYSLQDHFMDGR